MSMRPRRPRARPTRRRPIKATSRATRRRRGPSISKAKKAMPRRRQIKDLEEALPRRGGKSNAGEEAPRGHAETKGKKAHDCTASRAEFSSPAEGR